MKNKKILIIDDEKALARALELKLNHEGFETTVVFDGEMGLEVLEKESFALILLDLVMPKVGGFDVLKKLKEDKNTTPIIVLSNLGQEDDISNAKALGAKEFCVKSNTPITDIVNQVKRMLS